MSRQLISRSPDLQRLRDDGYAVTVQGAYLLIGDVPYLDDGCAIQRGTLITDLELSNDITVTPQQHVAYFAGGLPHDRAGTALLNLMNIPSPHQVGAFQVACSFSRKPAGGYRDYHHKMTTYVELVSQHVREVDPSATARTYPVIVEDGGGVTVFHYRDTASTRAGLEALNRKLEQSAVVIVGLGGTGAHILDLLAKTPVRQIDLFDGDRFIQHNAFRSPGATAGDQIAGAPNKAAYFAERYGVMRSGIQPHPYNVTAENVDELRSATFAFVAVDDGTARRLIVEHLEQFAVPFIDVGMGLWQNDDTLGGILRVTLSTPNNRDLVRDRLPTADNDPNNEYTRNIQVADLNALNATLAVIRWKRFLGYYQDTENAGSTTYVVGGNRLFNEDRT